MQAASILVLASSVLLAQQGAAKFSYPARVQQEDSCPSSEQKEAIRSDIDSDLNTLLQDFVAPPLIPCGGLGWRRVAYVNITESNSCPGTWVVSTYSGKATCFQRTASSPGCYSATFSTHEIPYNQVCGRVIGYQLGGTQAFHSNETSINSPYVDGVSVTHGSPRQHIWTFAAGYAEITTTSIKYLCPCSLDSINGARIPSFVGNNYFCDTGTVTYNGETTIFLDDPLWDGQGCGPNNNCCTFNSPPWFNVQLPSPTTDNIEVRICSTYLRTRGTPVELVIMYVR